MCEGAARLACVDLVKTKNQNTGLFKLITCDTFPACCCPLLSLDIRLEMKGNLDSRLIRLGWENSISNNFGNFAYSVLIGGLVVLAATDLPVGALAAGAGVTFVVGAALAAVALVAATLAAVALAAVGVFVAAATVTTAA